MNILTYNANAKINLFLEVFDKRADGYHNIETIFQSIDLCDTITFREEKSGIINLRCNNPQIPLDESNIVYRTATLLLDESGKNYGAEIYIDKKIPVGAGLAGGSTDASASLIGLNELWQLGYNIDDLKQFGSKLGSDVPFCISGGTALGKGRGEILTQLPSLDGIPIVIANPGFQISTAWAYGELKNLGLTRTRKNVNIFINKIEQNELSGIGDLLFNVFESLVIEKYPILQKLKDISIQSGAMGALMTGSGSTVFALAKDISSAEHISKQLKQFVDYCILAKTSSYSITKL